MKPHQSEERHVLHHELNRKLKDFAAAEQSSAEADKLRLKELHWMCCPKCGQNLVPAQNGAVEIDQCPNCKGVWLDANELETITDNESGVLRICMKILR
jgi:Zn finger protein HypA/HybF involved in hydrogenase expression